LFLVTPENVATAVLKIRDEQRAGGAGLTLFPGEPKDLPCPMVGTPSGGRFTVVCGVSYGSAIDTSTHLTAKAYTLYYRSGASFDPKTTSYVESTNLNLSLLTNSSIAR
jgi:hypothetical protein